MYVQTIPDMYIEAIDGHFEKLDLDDNGMFEFNIGKILAIDGLSMDSVNEHNDRDLSKIPDRYRDLLPILRITGVLIRLRVATHVLSNLLLCVM